MEGRRAKQSKMANLITTNKKAILIVATIILLFLAAVFMPKMLGALSKTGKTIYTVTVTMPKGVGAGVQVSCYGGGYGVTDAADSSTPYYQKVYHVEEGESITLNSINETAFFDYYSYDGNTPTTSRITISNITKNIDVEVKAKTIIENDVNTDPMMPKNVGKSFANPIALTNKDSYIALQKIILGTTTNANDTTYTERKKLLPKGILDKVNNGELLLSSFMPNVTCAFIQTAYIQVQENITLTNKVGYGAEDTPVAEQFAGFGSSTVAFKGVLDGNNKAINLEWDIKDMAATIYKVAPINYVAAKNSTESSMVRNMMVYGNINITTIDTSPAKDLCVGGIIGQADVNSLIFNNTSQVSVNVSSSYPYNASSNNVILGGIVGLLNNNDIYDGSKNAYKGAGVSLIATALNNNATVGGVVGRAITSSIQGTSAKLENVNIYADGGINASAGGIIRRILWIKSYN